MSTAPAQHDHSQELMIHRLGVEVIDALESHDQFFTPEGTGYVRDTGSGFKADLRFLDRSAERPEIRLEDARWENHRRVQIEVKVTEIGPPVPEIIRGNIRICRGDETDGDEFVIHIKSSTRRTGWTYLTDKISEGYAEVRKEHPEWPEIIGCDIGEFRGTMFYMSGPVPVEVLSAVHDLYVDAMEASKQ